MQVDKKEVNPKGIKLSIEEDGKEIARGFLYIMHNSLHEEPFGFMEDVFVQEEFRGKGYGAKIVGALIEEAKKQGCYKLIGTSRHSREKVHQFYEELGFYNRGIEFRMDF